jgi:hypothetical protein
MMGGGLRKDKGANYTLPGADKFLMISKARKED